jgi:nucleotide-binding universal stress UspA family protein
MQVAREVMVAKQPSRHMTYYDLSDALARPGCAVCRLVANAVDRYLRGLLHESVNNPGVRERLRASSGFCREHSWQLQRRGDPLSIAILWRDLLVVGFMGHSRIFERVWGSTSQTLTRLAPCSVLVAK